MRTRSLVPVLLTLALLTAGVASVGERAGAASKAIPVVSQPMVDLRISGGLAPVGSLFRELPVIYISSSRQFIVQGPQIAIFPSPALPNLVQQQLTKEGWELLVRSASKNGMLAARSSKTVYGRIDNIADAPTTRLSIRVGTKVYLHEAYALGLSGTGEGSGLTSAQRAARTRFENFVGNLQNVFSIVGVKNLGPERPLPLTEFRVQARPAGTAPGAAAGGPDDIIERQVLAWPVPTVALSGAASCASVTGPAATTLRTTLEQANSETQFTQEGVTYDVAIRPVLPGEPLCP